MNKLIFHCKSGLSGIHRTFGSLLACVIAVATCRPAALGQTFPSTGPTLGEINLVCIGDSITECKGVPDYKKNGSPAILAKTLAESLRPGTTVNLVNAGIGGTTTADWDGPVGQLVKFANPRTDKLIAAHPNGRLVFSIMLGTNDSANRGPHGSSASADQYGKRMQAIVDSLVARYPDCIIFLHDPIWYSKNIRVGSADYEGDAAHDRLRSYFPAIDAIVKADITKATRHVYLGDTEAYDHFAQTYLTELRPQDGKDGTFYLHPNEKGAAVLGSYWAAPILRKLKQ